MNSQSFQSYTPRIKPLNYDALKLNLGCEAISGEEFRGFAALARICVAEHDDASSKFSKMATIGQTFGPANTGETDHFHTIWTAWVGDSSVRVKKGLASVTPPANNLGEQSGLFPASIPTSVTISFSNIGQMAIAAQTGADQITLRRYTDSLGAIAETVITGRSPLLWFTGHLHASEEIDRNELVLLYLLPERPAVLFGRFESENFGTAHELVENLPVNLLSLNHAEATADGKLLIYARNDIGRDISIYSNPYPILGNDAGTLDLAFESGIYFESAVPEDVGEEFATLQLAFESGMYFDAIESGGTLTDDAASLTIAFVSGEYA